MAKEGEKVKSKERGKNSVWERRKEVRECREGDLSRGVTKANGKGINSKTESNLSFDKDRLRFIKTQQFK